MFKENVRAVKVSISSEVQGTKQSTEFELAEVTEFERVMILQNLFQVMGVENDLSQMIDDYAKIGRAYANFFKKVDPIESPSTEVTALKVTEQQQGSMASQLAEKLQAKGVNAEPVKHYSKHQLAHEYQKAGVTQQDTNIENNVPEHYKTGIKDENGVKKYQSRLVCKCGKQQTNYVEKDTKTVMCRDCGTDHELRWAKNGYLESDRFNNFFIAGSFVGEDER